MVQVLLEWWRSAGRVELLMMTFGLYLSVIIAFGFAYYLLFRQGHHRFVVMPKIAATKFRETKARLDLAVRLRRREIELMKSVGSAIASGDIKDFPASLPDGSVVTVDTHFVVHPAGTEEQERLDFRVVDRGGHPICDIGGPLDEPLSTSAVGRWLDTMLTTWKHRLNTEERRAKRLRVQPQRAWNLLDFMYFSSMTQTTAGYGDIVPNASIVRVFAMVQVLLGYWTFIVVLNIALTR